MHTLLYLVLSFVNIIFSYLLFTFSLALEPQRSCCLYHRLPSSSAAFSELRIVVRRAQFNEHKLVTRHAMRADEVLLSGTRRP